MANLATKANLERLVGAATLTQYSGGSDDRITDALSMASGDFRIAAKRRYDADEVDALDDTTIPIEWKKHVMAIAIETITKGVAGVPQRVYDDADEARKQLGFLATGNANLSGVALTGGGSLSGASRVRYRGPSERVFDRTNDSQTWNSRDPEL